MKISLMGCWCSSFCPSPRHPPYFFPALSPHAPGRWWGCRRCQVEGPPPQRRKVGCPGRMCCCYPPSWHPVWKKLTCQQIWYKNKQMITCFLTFWPGYRGCFRVNPFLTGLIIWRQSGLLCLPFLIILSRPNFLLGTPRLPLLLFRTKETQLCPTGFVDNKIAEIVLFYKNANYV